MRWKDKMLSITVVIAVIDWHNSRCASTWSTYGESIGRTCSNVTSGIPLDARQCHGCEVERIIGAVGIAAV